MSKIRINELARQLEIPSHEILEMLPELGVAEKKTHSSSIDEDVAEKIRRRTHGGEGLSPGRAVSSVPVAVAEPEVAVQVETLAEPRPSLPHAPAPVEEVLETPVESSAAPLAEEMPRTKPAPLRPPLAAGGGAPVHPPLRTTPLPARPAPPPPRPGQILSGPRQPMPQAAASPTPPASITLPHQPAARTSAPVETAAPPAPAPGAPIRPQPRVPLAGQPAARPVVPPRPDMVARLQQQQARPGAAPAPQAPRPGMPTRSATPVPGQPIYRGPIRPGQPVMRGPGVGAPGSAPPGFRRPRAPHPTSSPLRAEPATLLPTEQQRRHQAKPAGRDRHRDQEQEEGRLRMPIRRSEAAAPPPIDREITISEGVTVKELSEKLGIKANLVIKKLVEKKIFATINQNLDAKMAEEIAREFGASTNKVSFEEESSQVIEQAEESSDRVKRAPVVTIMGHVDHGKTSLLDAIRSANVAEREAGGITQHIGAYYVEKNGRKIVFIDTPGHEAFTRMRARGAKVTDIVVLVVAADDGVMPQTLEAIDHAKAAGVPIIVAINKIDKPDAQPERIKQQLADRGLLAEDWGGETVMVPVSAKAKTNLDLLLEMILLVADMQDLKANPDRPAVGNVLEANLDRGRGPVATVLVRNGTLRVGDYFICGSVFGKVRAMFDDRGNPLRDAEPSMPVEVLGLESLPEVGDTFQVVTDTAKAKQIVLYREAKARDVAMAKTGRVTLEQLHEQLKEGEVKELNIILKTDVSGTAEVLSDMMQKLSNDKVRIRVLRGAVGAINESDVLLASTSDAIIVGFNVRPERNASALAEQEKVDIRLHTIIYELTDELKRAMTGMLEPVFKEVYQGRAEIREVFRISKVGNVAGCMVLDGIIKRDSEVRVLRDNVVVFTGKVDSLKRFKNDASEVKSGFECGITIRNFGDVKPGDIIEAFATERVAAEVMA
ncbi:MAG TPA: translation initiation factor IF-2 [Bryobacteraceae bacterium]|nr:translation initiation factor IF-2 [Bryobacteraceae bacterium]